MKHEMAPDEAAIILSAAAEWMAGDFQRKYPRQAHIELKRDSDGILMVFHPRSKHRLAKPYTVKLTYVEGEAGPYCGAVLAEPLG